MFDFLSQYRISKCATEGLTPKVYLRFTRGVSTYFITGMVLFGIFFNPFGDLVFGQKFTNAKYGSDFLNAGAGARAMAMGQTQTAISDDATSLFWNPAGLMQLHQPDLFLMHSERFAGTVAYDFIGLAWPLSASETPSTNNESKSSQYKAVIPQAVVAFGVIRQGVDGIQNTLNAWDPERNRPREDAESFIEEFNVSDLAFYLSYAQSLRLNLNSLSTKSLQITTGASLKAIHHNLGPFANAWGYGLDAGIQARTEKWRLGLQVTDLLPMMKFWTVDTEALAPLQTEYGDFLPTGKNEKVLPALRFGMARKISFSEAFSGPMSQIELLVSSDLQFRAENRQAYYINLGRISLEPHIGLEGSYRNIVYIRTGLTDFILPDGENITMTPSVGTGLKLGKLRIDYGFTDFSGYASDLGVTHRISLGYAFR